MGGMRWGRVVLALFDRTVGPPASWPSRRARVCWPSSPVEPPNIDGRNRPPREQRRYGDIHGGRRLGHAVQSLDATTLLLQLGVLLAVAFLFGRLAERIGLPAT